MSDTLIGKQAEAKIDQCLDNPDEDEIWIPIVGHPEYEGLYMISNLEWSTYQENTQHAIQHGLMKCSDRHHMKMMSNFSNKRKKIKCIETGQIYPSIKDCAKAMNIRLGYLYEYTSNHARSCHGYHFELLE